jgi:hypothetical protein
LIAWDDDDVVLPNLVCQIRFEASLGRLSTGVQVVEVLTICELEEASIATAEKGKAYLMDSHMAKSEVELWMQS